MVSATDMTKHFTDVSKLKSRIHALSKEARERELFQFSYLFALIGLEELHFLMVRLENNKDKEIELVSKYDVELSKK